MVVDPAERVHQVRARELVGASPALFLVDPWPVDVALGVGTGPGWVHGSSRDRMVTNVSCSRGVRSTSTSSHSPQAGQRTTIPGQRK